MAKAPRSAAAQTQINISKSAGGELKITGIGNLKLKLKRLEELAPKEVAAALYQEGLEIQKQSMLRTPVWTGALRASHDTEKPQKDGVGTYVRIKVGGPAAPYAGQVHEDIPPRYHRVGQAKFLETALNNARRGMAQRIAKRVKVVP